MLKGRFGNTSGRPYIEALVILPQLDMKSAVSFLVDTGADRTVLMPGDAKRIGIDCRQLSRAGEMVGVGGTCRNYFTSAYVLFSEESRRLFAYRIDIQIAEEKPEIMDIPSLLGRDILSQWRMNCSPKENLLTFHVLSADMTTLLSKRSARPKPAKLK